MFYGRIHWSPLTYKVSWCSKVFVVACLWGRFHWAIVLLELPIALGLIGGTLGWFGALLLHT